MNTKPKADWVNIDPATLTQDQANFYANYKAQYRVMKAARLEFEQSMQVGVEAGMKIVCGYNYGKLSVALVVDDDKPAAPAKSPVSLAAYLAQRKASGQAA